MFKEAVFFFLRTYYLQVEVQHCQAFTFRPRPMCRKLYMLSRLPFIEKSCKAEQLCFGLGMELISRPEKPEA